MITPRGLGSRRKKPNFTTKTVLAELDHLCLRFKKSLKGHRSHLYDLMGSVALILFRLEGNEKLRASLTLKVKKKQVERGSRSSEVLNLTTELMAMATGAQSRQARQLAFKRGRVLDYLRERGVKPKKTASAIRSKGGIERIYAEAVKTSERPAETSQPKNSRSATAPRIGEATPFKTTPRSNDGETTLSVRIRASDRDEILENTIIGSHIKLSALRVGKGDGDIKITRIKITHRKDVSKDGDDDDDDEDASRWE